MISVKSWIEEIRENCDPETSIMVLGNKTDLFQSSPNKKPDIDKEDTKEIEEFCKEQNAVFEMVSAKHSQEEIKAKIGVLARSLFKRKSRSPSFQIKMSSKPKNKKSCEIF